MDFIRKLKIGLGLAAALALVPIAALSQAGIGLVTTPPSGSTIDLNTTSPTNVAITADNLAAWVGSSGSQGDSVIGTGVNKISLAGGATTVPPAITVGGTSSDTNIGLFVAAKGTGVTYIGGTTTTLAGLQVAQTASRVNSIVVTPSATGTAPSIAIGGAGADANRNLSVAAAGTGIVNFGQAVATCSGTTTATCSGQRFVVSVTGLTTAAAGTTSAAMTVTNTSIASSAVLVHCQVNGYAGTGVPIATTIIPGTSQVSFTITNVAGSGALNATVPVACVAF